MRNTGGKVGLALEQFKAARDPENEATVLLDLDRRQEAAEKYEQIGRQLKAAKAYEGAGNLSKAAVLYSEANEDREFIRVCQAGKLFRELGEYYESKHRYADAADAYEQAGELGKVAQVCQRSGDHQRAGEVYVVMGDYAAAEEEYRRAKDVRGFILQLKSQGATQALERMKAKLMADYMALQRLDKDKDAKKLRDAYPELLVERLDLLSPDGGLDANLARHITWGAVTFFESQGDPAGLERSYEALQALNGLESRGFPLEAMERLALLGRLIFFTAIKGRSKDLKQYLGEFRQALGSTEKPVWETLKEEEKRFLRTVVARTTQVLSSRGDLHMARELEASLIDCN